MAPIFSLMATTTIAWLSLLTFFQFGDSLGQVCMGQTVAASVWRRTVLLHDGDFALRTTHFRHGKRSFVIRATFVVQICGYYISERTKPDRRASHRTHHPVEYDIKTTTGRQPTCITLTTMHGEPTITSPHDKSMHHVFQRPGWRRGSRHVDDV